MIYVDQIFTATPRTAQARRHGMQWCHMTGDDPEELHQFAEKLGLKRAYFQAHYLLPHYDLTRPMRRRALELGAKEATTAERVQWAVEQRKQRMKEGLPKGTFWWQK